MLSMDAVQQHAQQHTPINARDMPSHAMAQPGGPAPGGPAAGEGPSLQQRCSPSS
eukprot:CAMPEP_0176130342 /NCGR_PEP_ID=MMETSP0120_2-20121206/65947_1 /TAXON_ID=160619 /ORGANISM="Kryptoperidinium foliaceum, Strain CCMP 1326" /LENGTH=54 /DNA_ID=CAMNT_0017465627 /DNA_START=138 /DNA_END=299 /DNA_ORIENTATION=+